MQFNCGSPIVSVHGFHGEGGEADGDVFGAAFLGCGVTDPFAGVGDDGLSGGDVEGAALVFDAQQALQHDREFVELGRLAGFEPALRAAHVSHAGRGSFGVDAANVFVDELRFVAGRLDARGLGNECGHELGFRFSVSAGP